ncbi:MAG: response regulator transcription factor [Melioribacteraceae bacterium]|jgi:DNA-binding response OmpR family regulator|nr:response regulator transcription factor [Melioribacteraceae bacterium]
MKPKILLIEDEESLALGLDYNLTEEGYYVVWADNGKSGIEKFLTDNYDLIILDIMLPYLDGFEVAKKIRESDPKMPILILTARANAVDKIKGLEIGADDYITKPFNLDELLLRIKGMLKRKAWYNNLIEVNSIYKFGNNEINFDKLICKVNEDAFPLTQREAMVMQYLIERKDKIVTRQELLENVWHINPDIETRTVDNFIARLRKYFEDDPSNPVYIKSVRSVGYTFSAND